jgi:hypothetical protein
MCSHCYALISSSKMQGMHSTLEHNPFLYQAITCVGPRHGRFGLLCSACILGAELLLIHLKVDLCSLFLLNESSLLDRTRAATSADKPLYSVQTKLSTSAKSHLAARARPTSLTHQVCSGECTSAR